MGTVTVGAVRERAPGERRVALVPEAVTLLRRAGIDVLVEAGAGSGAWFTDAEYTEAGATGRVRGGAVRTRRRRAVRRTAGPGERRGAAHRADPDRPARTAPPSRPRRRT
ncbi:hypothetical protein ACRAWF_04030 [Streptomyces sp. L7]